MLLPQGFGFVYANIGITDKEASIYTGGTEDVYECVCSLNLIHWRKENSIDTKPWARDRAVARSERRDSRFTLCPKP